MRNYLIVIQYIYNIHTFYRRVFVVLENDTLWHLSYVSVLNRRSVFIIGCGNEEVGGYTWLYCEE